MALGQHKIEYEVLEGWDRLPDGWTYVEVAGVACDSHDRVYVFNRGAHPVIVFDKEGRFLNAWGEGLFKNPHGIFIDRNDHLWLADDKDHTVHKFTPDGKRLMTLGESGAHAVDEGSVGAAAVSVDERALPHGQLAVPTRDPEVEEDHLVVGVTAHPGTPARELEGPRLGVPGPHLDGREPPIRDRDRKSTRLNSSHIQKSRMPSSA